MKKTILGLSTLALVGTLAFTGCNKNTKVNEQTNETVTSITKDEAYDILLATYYRFQNNVDGVRNNLIIVNETPISKSSVSIYVDDKTGNEYILHEEESGTNYYEYALFYSKPQEMSSDEIYMYARRMNNGPVEVTKRLDGYGKGVYYIWAKNNSHLLPVIVEKDYLLEYKVLENGNYQLSFVLDEKGTNYSSTYFTVEITKDYRFISYESNGIGYYVDSDNVHSEYGNDKIVYKYGEANVSKINEMLIAANNS